MNTAKVKLYFLRLNSLAIGLWVKYPELLKFLLVRGSQKFLAKRTSPLNLVSFLKMRVKAIS